MKRLQLTLSILIAVGALVSPRFVNAGGFEIVETTISDIQDAYASGTLTPEELVRMYLDRIGAYDTAGPQLNSYMHVNDQALDTARSLKNDGSQPLFGIPVILKDNINTMDMPTTAGSITLDGSVPPSDAFIANKLRQAGAIILGKATLTEFANFLTSGMPTGYSSELRWLLYQRGGDLARVGYGFNPYDPRPDPREGMNDGRPALQTGGSSSGPGIAVSANLATVGVGTETSGSILSPGTMNLLVGIKPTVGLVSRTGIVPITADQDTAGPLARTVTDAAKLLGVLAGFDPDDPATAACLNPGNCFDDYTPFLNPDALNGARIAVPHYTYWTDFARNVNLSAEQQQVMNDAIDVLRSAGATVEDPFEIPDQDELNAFGSCSVHGQLNCTTVLLYGFKRDLNHYLDALGPGAPVSSLADVIDVNNNFIVDGVAIGLKYGQTLALASNQFDTTKGSDDTQRYQQDRAEDIDLAATRGLDVVFQNYDAVLFPANRGANIGARAGYPSIVVPGGFVPNPAVPPPPLPPPPEFPPGFDAKDSPYGVTFTGPAFSEPTLIGFAYAFEQLTQHRTPPDSTPPLGSR